MKAESIAWLRENVPQGSAVFTILTHVSRSGMSRNIKIIIPWTNWQHEEHGIDNISWHVARALELPHHDRDSAVRVAGCGMDMGFWLVTQLSYALGYNNDPATGRPSGKPDGITNAYGLNHFWL